jgi:hypothetical protein
MIKTLNSWPDILIEDTDGRMLQMPPKDFPTPENEGDRVEVEQLIEKQIKEIFPEYIIKVHIYKLDPPEIAVTYFTTEPPEDWWVI